MTIERIYIQEILQFIRKSDRRSVYAWCKRNQLNIIRDGRDEYVIKEEFELAYNRPSLINLKSIEKPQRRKEYKPQGQKAKALKEKLSQI